MGTYDLEKEIYHILQDSSKIRDYNAKLRSEYMKLNDEFRRLKVENSKLIFQNACTEISLAKSKADNFAKLEEVKSLQSVINLLAPGLGLRSISVIIESNRSVISFWSVNLIEFTNISVLVNYRSVSVNSVSVSVFLFTEPIYRLYN